MLRKKYNQSPLDNKKRAIINTLSSTLDETGPMAISLSKGETFKKRYIGIDSVDVINIVHCAVILFGNAYFVFMSDRRKGLLSRILPDCEDLVDDSMAKKSLLK